MERYVLAVHGRITWIHAPRVDSDVYIWKNIKGNGTCYYKLVLVYVDDYLVVSCNLEKSTIVNGDKFEIKDMDMDCQLDFRD